MGIPKGSPHGKFIRIGSWNMHGIYDTINKFQLNKLESPSFLNILKAHDILCLQETHVGQNDMPVEHLTDFKAIPHCRAISSNGRYYGGMMLLVRKNIRPGVKITNTDNRDILGVTLKQDFFGLTRDRTIWFTYAPPINSPYLINKDGVLSTLEAYMITKDEMENTLILGDLNGKTAKASDYVSDATDQHSPITDIVNYRRTPADIPLKRNNEDSHPVDKQGQLILEMCRAFNLSILNGRTAGDRFGRVTRYPINRFENPSTIDYAIISANLLKHVKSFIVFPYTDLSDHCCISVNMPANNISSTSPKPTAPLAMPPPRPPFQTEHLDTYQHNLMGDDRFAALFREIKERMADNTDPTDFDINSWTGKFNEQILENATKSFSCPKKQNTQKKKVAKKPAIWYTNSCSASKKRYQRTLNKMTKNPFDKSIQQQYLVARKDYKKKCREAENQCRQRLLNKLLQVEAQDPKEFWKILDKMRHWGKEKPDPSDNVPPDKWSAYFTQLLNNKNSQKLQIDSTKLPFDPEMDGRIQMEELKTTLKIAKDGKSFGPDVTIMEYIKYAPDNVLKTLLVLLNAIYCHSKYPSQWTTNYLKVIYKKGETEDPNNYRGLAIGSCIAKLYSSILLGRLEKFAIRNKIIPPQQIGFRRGFRTADHVYLLKTLISKTFCEKGKLYAAFIDFKKAYDTVNRAKLLNKLQEIGVSGTFLRNIQALYSKTEYKIKLKNKVLEAISSNLGLKQGCPLSPLLFNIYISDLGSYLSTSDSDPKLHGTYISHFLYADDLVLVATSKEGLQKKLDGLSKFANDKDLTVNQKKSQIIIFNKSGRKYKEEFTLNGTKLETVQSYTYLGVEMTACGSFSLATRELNNKARKAMIPLFKTIAQFRIPFTRGINLFRTYVEPILLYNAENWACLTSKEITNCKKDNSLLHKIALDAPPTTCQLKFYKYMLGVGTNSPNLSVLGEVSEHPLKHKAHLSLLKYWNRIKDMEEDTLVKKAYHENIALNTNWCQTVQVLNASLKLNQGTIPEDKFTSISKLNMRNSFKTFWREEIDKQPPRKKFYAQTKENFRKEIYIDTLPFKDRQRISKLLCSNHNLEIEKGRHTNPITVKALRICKMCTSGAIEDEDHFLNTCPAYTKLRDNILTTPQVRPGTNNTILQYEPDEIARYLREANDLREDSLAPWAVNNLSLCSMKMSICKKRDGIAKFGKPQPLRVTNRTDRGLKFRIGRQKLRQTLTHP